MQAQAQSAGSLKITVVEAQLSRDTETFGKMDPYVKIESRMQKFKTNTINGGGKTPKWANQTFTLDVKYIGDDVTLSVWDEDPGADDQVGSALIKISAMTGNGTGIDEWFPIQYKGKQSGTVHLKTVYTDYSKQQAKAAGGVGYAAGQ